MAVNKTGYLIGAVAAAGFAAAAFAGAAPDFGPSPATQDAKLIRASTAPIFAPPPGAPLSFADIFDRVSPAVVSIDVTTRVDPRNLRIPGLEGFPFRVIPPGGRQQPNPDGDDKDGGGADGGDGPGGQPELPQGAASGSGFFISSSGYIVTNNHVLENATEIKVTLKDKRELTATVVGRDEATDLAVIKVEGSGFPYVNFEDSAKPRVGDWVIAVGNPFGLGGTATAGIVSAYGRDIGETFVDYIQIDAPINRGNSGGPTFDIYGRVIGVNTAIFSPSGGSVGIGFAIPADVADKITKQLMSGKAIARGYIGATIQNLTPDMAESLGMPGRKGAIISSITAGGPAARAGLQAGDVVTAVNGVAVASNSELTRQVAGAAPGDNLRLDVLRGGKPTAITIRAGTRPSERELNAANDNDDENPNGGDKGEKSPTPQRQSALGMTFSPLDPATAQRLNMPSNLRGVVVESVSPSSDAGRKGLRRGDVITGAGDRPVTSGQDVINAVNAAKAAGRKNVLLQVFRGGANLFLPLKIEP